MIRGPFPSTRFQGFTLIETVVYIALLSLIMGGTLVVTYELLAGQGRSSAHDTAEEEGGFVLGKFAWAMGQITATDTPSISTHFTHELAIRSAGEWVQLCQVGLAVMIREAPAKGTCGDAGSLPLTTSNVTVSALGFEYLPAANGAPDGLAASTTIDGESFSLTRYLRR